MMIRNNRLCFNSVEAKNFSPRLNFYLAIYFLTATVFVSAQDSSALEKFKPHVPEGYSIHTVTEGNLNLDSRNDAILVLVPNGEDSLSSQNHPLSRKFCLLLGKKDGSYRLESQNDNVVYHYMYDANFRDAFTGLTLEDGMFSVQFYGGMRMRWYRTVSFKYSPKKKDWYLVSDNSGTFDSLGEDESLTTETVLTEKDFGKVPFSEFNLYK